MAVQTGTSVKSLHGRPAPDAEALHKEVTRRKNPAEAAAAEDISDTWPAEISRTGRNWSILEQQHLYNLFAVKQKTIQECMQAHLRSYSAISMVLRRLGLLDEHWKKVRRPPPFAPYVKPKREPVDFPPPPPKTTEIRKATPKALAKFRFKHHLDAAQAAALCNTPEEIWNGWEGGDIEIPSCMAALLIEFDRRMSAARIQADAIASDRPDAFLLRVRETRRLVEVLEGARWCFDPGLAPLDGSEFLGLLSNGWQVAMAAPPDWRGGAQGWWVVQAKIEVPIVGSHQTEAIDGNVRLVAFRLIRLQAPVGK